MATEIYLGNPPQYVIDWIKAHSQPAVEPSPYFTYDSNRVITGLHQGSPNVQDSGTYIDYNDWYYAEQHDGEFPEKQYSGWTYGGGSNMVENYATAIGNNAFDDSTYYMESIPPSKAITGNITFQNVTSIRDYAFCTCTNLMSATMPNVTSIGNSAFRDCSNLTSVTIGSGIQRIGGSAFETHGENPVTLTIGKSVAEVEDMGTTDYDYSTNVPYSEWGLPSGSTIVCTDGTIPID